MQPRHLLLGARCGVRPLLGEQGVVPLGPIVRDDDRALGYVQATIRRSGSEIAADIAWVVRPEEQGRGVATEAASAVVQHLLAHGVGRIRATIADANAASTAVARRLGMQRTTVEQDGEQVWLLDDS